jgi:hypothetical protein
MRGRRNWRQRSRHEVHILGTHAIRGHDEIAFILPVFIVHDHSHLAAAQILENLIDGIECRHGSTLRFSS